MAKFKGLIPKELLNSISEKKCILFVGAGLSSKVVRSNGKPLPAWKGLLTELLDYCVEKRVPFSVDVKDLEQMISNDNLIMVAQEIQETIRASGGIGETCGKWASGRDHKHGLIGIEANAKGK